VARVVQVPVVLVEIVIVAKCAELGRHAGIAAYHETKLVISRRDVHVMDSYAAPMID